MLERKVSKRLEEKEVIEELVNWAHINGSSDLRAFTNLFMYTNDFDKLGPYSGYLIKENVLRSDLGFDPNAKPGDFDVIIIPFRETTIHFEKTAVFEVKIVRPTRSKPTRNANSLGVTQVNGLIKDGFPFVGLIHVSMTEPLLESEKQPIQIVEQPLSIDDPKANKDLFDEGYTGNFDFFGFYSCNKQMQRLISMDIPKYVGLGSYALNFHVNGEMTLESCTQEYWSFQNGYLNPNQKKETIEKVKEFVEKNIEGFSKKLLKINRT